MSTKRNLARQNPRLEVDLKSIFGRSIPRNDALKEAIGQAILDKIVERTKRGKDKDGKRFKKYSDSYKNSLAFKSFGKSENRVDLTLSGDMLGLMDVIKIKGNKLTIGWDDDDEQGKAHGHITGEGKPPRRDFFDLRPGEIRSIRSEFREAIEEIRDTPRPSESFILSVIERIRDSGADQS